MAFGNLESVNYCCIGDIVELCEICISDRRVVCMDQLSSYLVFSLMLFNLADVELQMECVKKFSGHSLWLKKFK